MQEDLELKLENLETFHPSFYSREMDFIVIILIPDRVDERKSDGWQHEKSFSCRTHGRWWCAGGGRDWSELLASFNLSWWRLFFCCCWCDEICTSLSTQWQQPRKRKTFFSLCAFFSNDWNDIYLMRGCLSLQAARFRPSTYSSALRMTQLGGMSETMWKLHRQLSATGEQHIKTSKP